MIAAPSSAETAPPDLDQDHDDPDEAMAARHSSMLAELADIAMQLARAAGRKALAQAEITEADGQGDAGQGDPGLAFTRMARCVRQTLALQARLAQARRMRADAGHDHPLADPGALEAVREKIRRKLAAAVAEAVAAAREADGEQGDREDLLADLHERLDDEDPADRGGLPVGEAVARLRGDLERLADAGDDRLAAPAAPVTATRPPPSAGHDRWPFPAANGERGARQPRPSGPTALPP